MAKKSDAKPTAKTPRRKAAAKEISLSPGERAGVRAVVPRPSDERGIKGEGRPSSLLDTRVVYCGDNLEQLAKLPDACRKPMQKEECRMMKPPLFPILHSSFHLLPLPHYHCDWHASHYVKVMLAHGKSAEIIK